MGELKIRNAKLNDSKEICEIYNFFIRGGVSTLETQERTIGYIKDIIQNLNTRERVLVAELGSKVIGWAAMREFNFRTGYETTCESSVYVLPDYKGRAVGSKLMCKFFEEASVLGYHHIVARVLSSNAGSLAFHLRQGYSVVGVQKEVGVIKGKWIDMTILQKLLS